MTKTPSITITHDSDRYVVRHVEWERSPDIFDEWGEPTYQPAENATLLVGEVERLADAFQLAAYYTGQDTLVWHPESKFGEDWEAEFDHGVPAFDKRLA